MNSRALTTGHPWRRSTAHVRARRSARPIAWGGRPTQAILVVICCLLLAWYLRNAVVYARTSLQFDFVQGYIVSHHRMTGPELYELEYVNSFLPLSLSPEIGLRTVGAGYLYPPLVTTFLIPIAMLPFEQARVVWVALNAVAWLLVGPLLCLATWSRPQTIPILLSLILAMLLLPSQASIGMGQIDTLTVFLVALSAAVGNTRFSMLAGIPLAISGFFKIYPWALIAPSVLRLNIATVTLFIVSILLFALMNLLVYGVATSHVYIQTFLSFGTVVVPLAGSVSIPSVLRAFLMPGPVFDTVNNVIRLLLIAGLAYLLWIQRSARWQLPSIALISTVLTVLPGVSWHSRLIWLILPIFCLTFGAYRSPRLAWMGRTLGFGILVAAGLIVFLAPRFPTSVTWVAIALNVLLVASMPLLASVDPPSGAAQPGPPGPSRFR